MSIHVEPAQAADGPQIGAILSDWIDETPWMPRIHTKEQDVEHGGWLIDRCAVTVAREADQVTGFLACQGCDIQALYVAHGAQQRGVGSALLKQAKCERDALGLWTFQANDRALRFYRQHGFVEDQRSDGAGNDEKLPDIHMIWQRGKA